MREEILEAGRARPHRAGVKGYVSYPVESEEDVAGLLRTHGQNYE